MKNLLTSPLLWGGLFFGWALSACQSSTGPTSSPERYGFKKIHAYVRYFALRRELFAELTFQTDSTKALEGSVELNGTPMTFRPRPIVGLQYMTRHQVPQLEQRQTFTYTEKDGSTQSLELMLPAFDSIKILSNGILSHTTGGLIGWEGAVFDKQDGLVLVFTDAEGQTFSVNHNGQTNGTQYPLSESVVQRLALGQGRLDIIRKRINITKTDSCSTWTTIEYYTHPIVFDIQP